MVEVVEHYPNPEDRPSSRIARTIKLFVAAMPEPYLYGLGSVVLTNSSALSAYDKKRTHRRSRTGKQQRVLGTYYQSWKGQPARIELYVDNITAGDSPTLLKLPFFCDVALAPTFFHELGHHLHASKRPEHRDSEVVAEEWAEALQSMYFRRRFRVFLLLFWPVVLYRRAMARIRTLRRPAS